MHSARAPRSPATLLALAFATLCCGPAPAGGDPATSEEIVRRITLGDAPLVLDVRSRDEYAQGHIPGAVNIPHDELAARLGELSAAKSDEIVVHCERGGRAAAAEAVLRDAGYSDVRDLAGHMQGWREADLPVDTLAGARGESGDGR